MRKGKSRDGEGRGGIPFLELHVCNVGHNSVEVNVYQERTEKIEKVEMGDNNMQFQQARPKLFGLAYRMLGIRADAEDVIQDAWLRWNKIDTTTIEDPEAWLTAVVTRLAIDRQRSIRARREDYIGPWLPEPLISMKEKGSEDIMELSGDLSLAFLFAMERLGADQRAAFILREVFDYSYEEISGLLGKSVMASRKLVSRARASVRNSRPRYSVTPEQERSIASRFADAMMAEDREGFVRLMADQVRWIADGGGKVNAASRIVQGVRATSRLAMGLTRRWGDHLKATVEAINGKPGVVLWLDGRLQAAIELETDGYHVLGIYSVVNPEKLRVLSGSAVCDSEVSHAGV